MLHPYQILLPLLSLFLVRVDLTDILPLDLPYQDLQWLDGDTVSLRLPMGFHRLRIARVDAPEKGQPFLTGKGDAGVAARNCADKTLQRHPSSRVRIRGLDMYGRLLGDLSGDLSYQLVKNGCLSLYPFAVFNNQAEKHRYLRAQNEAKRNKRGLWARGGYLTPGVWRKLSRKYANRR